MTADYFTAKIRTAVLSDPPNTDKALGHSRLLGALIQRSHAEDERIGHAFSMLQWQLQVLGTDLFDMARLSKALEALEVFTRERK